MRRNAFSPYLFLLILSGCSYRLGEPESDIWGHPIHLEVLANHTLYPNLTQRLRLKLVEALKAEQGPRLGQNEKGALPLGGSLKEVKKVVLEKDAFGRPTEFQFQLSFSLRWNKKTRKITNMDLNHSSGLFRPYDNNFQSNDAGRALSEREALDEALEDLALAILLEIRRPSMN